MVPIPKLVPVNTKLAESVNVVPPLFVNIMRLAVNEPGVSVRAKKVVTPPPPPVIPSVEVATQRVEAPVDCKTIPAVPAELSPSRSAPVRYKSPTTLSLLDGVEVPTPTFPLASTNTPSSSPSPETQCPLRVRLAAITLVLAAAILRLAKSASAEASLVSRSLMSSFNSERVSLIESLALSALRSICLSNNSRSTPPEVLVLPPPIEARSINQCTWDRSPVIR